MQTFQISKYFFVDKIITEAKVYCQRHNQRGSAHLSNGSYVDFWIFNAFCRTCRLSAGNGVGIHNHQFGSGKEKWVEGKYFLTCLVGLVEMWV